MVVSPRPRTLRGAEELRILAKEKSPTDWARAAAAWPDSTAGRSRTAGCSLRMRAVGAVDRSGTSPGSLSGRGSRLADAAMGASLASCAVLDGLVTFKRLGGDPLGSCPEERSPPGTPAEPSRRTISLDATAPARPFGSPSVFPAGRTMRSRGVTIRAGATACPPDESLLRGDLLPPVPRPSAAPNSRALISGAGTTLQPRHPPARRTGAAAAPAPLPRALCRSAAPKVSSHSGSLATTQAGDPLSTNGG